MLFLWALAFLLVLHKRDPSDAHKAVQCFAKLTVRCNNLTLAVHTYHAAADPLSVAPGSLEGGSWCNEHMLHERLDIIEEKVIKTVEHLESEVKSLLNIISETTSNIPTAPGTPLIDIFDDTS